MMVDALITACIKISLEKMVSFAAPHIDMFKGFDKELQRIGEIVKMISGLLDDAEKKQVESEAVKVWLKSLEAVACRAEHLLDEVNYQMNRRRAERKVHFFTPHVFRMKIFVKLKDIKNEFELVNKNATALGLQFQVETGVNAGASREASSRETVSVVGQEVIGRGEEEEAIVHKLLGQCNQVLASIPIVGIGGLGKTTLAQSVYNNPQVVDHFGQRIWVWIPQDCAPQRVPRLILQSLPNYRGKCLDIHDKPLEVVLEDIRAALKYNRHLLVLDDVWTGQCESSWDQHLNEFILLSFINHLM